MKTVQTNESPTQEELDEFLLEVEKLCKEIDEYLKSSCQTGINTQNPQNDSR